MKVRVGSKYKFQPCLTDLAMPQHYDAKPGETVKVVKLPGAPPPNTMGQCHIANLDDRFLGMVSTASLVPL
jgi:hypothetical protein